MSRSYAVTAWGSVDHPPISYESTSVPPGLMAKYPLVSITAVDLVDRLKWSTFQDAPAEKRSSNFS
jgi:hypothetical protein